MKTVSVLFVCLGNICRSPIAESIAQNWVERNGLSHLISLDSAGTGRWHQGEWPDSRAQQTIKANGMSVCSRARQVTTADFQNFDYIVAMDESNLDDLINWNGAIPSKVSRLLDWNPESPIRNVPDPYYGGQDGFERVFELISEGVERLMLHISKELQESEGIN